MQNTLKIAIFPLFALALLAQPVWAARASKLAEDRLDREFPRQQLEKLPAPTLDFIWPVRAQVIEELAKLYQDRRAIPAHYIASEIDAAVDRNLEQEKNLLAFFKRHVAETLKRYESTPEENVESAKRILELKTKLLIKALTKIDALKPTSLHLEDEKLPEPYRAERDELLQVLSQAEILTQEISFQLAKVVELKRLKGQYLAQVTSYHFGKLLLIPVGLAELALRIAIFPGLPAYEIFHGSWATGIVLGIGMWTFRGLLNLGNGLLNLGNGGAARDTIYFLPNATLAIAMDFPPEPRMETKAVPASGDNPALAAVMEHLESFASEEDEEWEGPVTPENFLQRIRARLSRSLVYLSEPCTRVLTGDTMKVEAYLKLPAPKK